MKRFGPKQYIRVKASGEKGKAHPPPPVERQAPGNSLCMSSTIGSHVFQGHYLTSPLWVPRPPWKHATCSTLLPAPQGTPEFRYCRPRERIAWHQESSDLSRQKQGRNRRRSLLDYSVINRRFGFTFAGGDSLDANEGFGGELRALFISILGILILGMYLPWVQHAIRRSGRTTWIK